MDCVFIRGIQNKELYSAMDCIRVGGIQNKTLLEVGFYSEQSVMGCIHTWGFYSNNNAMDCICKTKENLYVANRVTNCRSNWIGLMIHVLVGADRL